MNPKTRISTLSLEGIPLMPTQYRRAQKWIDNGEAEWVSNDLNIKAVRLLRPASGHVTQPVSVGCDPGKDFAGIATVSHKATLFAAHLVLPRAFVTQKMDTRRLLRRARRGRRINRKLPFHMRAHREKRFNNRRQGKLPPSVSASRLFEFRVIRELCRLFPVTQIVYELVKARTNNGKGKGFSPVMVGQQQMVQWLSVLAPVTTQLGWQTAILRRQLGLVKSKNKAEQTPQTHAVDGIALAASSFLQFKPFQTATEHGHHWVGSIQLTSTAFRIITRARIYRRQLHFENPVSDAPHHRKRKGGTVTPFGLRSGDFVSAQKAGISYRGWVGGFSQTEKTKKISVYDANWKRIGQFSPAKVQLIKRSTKLCIV